MTDNTLYLIKAFILGIIEGLTEFLPVSSTGHLILFGDWISFDSGDAKVFEVVIQLGAILAVIWLFRERVWQLIKGTLTGQRQEVLFTRNLLIAFFPAVIIGVIFIKHIKTLLYNPPVVATALIIGGFIILLVERRPQSRATAHTLEDISWKQALAVGCAQCIAMIPGTSRSGATIIGGMAAGISRKTATEFSFFLAMPTMLGAAVFDTWRNFDVLTSQDLSGIAVGFIGAFISALFIVRALLRFVANHSYRIFAWYRIVLGGVLIIWMLMRT